jgi:hypothetical protein
MQFWKTGLEKMLERNQDSESYPDREITVRKPRIRLEDMTQEDACRHVILL